MAVPLIAVTGLGSPVKKRVCYALFSGLSAGARGGSEKGQAVNLYSFASALFGRFDVCDISCECRELSREYTRWCEVMGGCDSLVFVADVGATEGKGAGWAELRGLDEKFGREDVAVWMVGEARSGGGAEAAQEAVRGRSCVKVEEMSVMDAMSRIVEGVGGWGIRGMLESVVECGGVNRAVLFDRKLGLCMGAGRGRRPIQIGEAELAWDAVGVIMALAQVYKANQQHMVQVEGTVRLGNGKVVYVKDVAEELVLVYELRTQCVDERIDILKHNARIFSEALRENMELRPR